MEKIKAQIVEEISKKRKEIKELYLSKGYDLAILDIIKILNDKLIESSDNKPSSLDLIIDLDLIEDKFFKSISREDAVKLFYYKLGWDRGNSRIKSTTLNVNELKLKKIV